MNKSVGAALIVLVACGNPITLKKDLNTQQDLRQSADAQNQQLTSDNATAKRYLQSILVSDHYLWFLAAAPVPFDEAQSLCAAVGYQLPTSAQLDEFNVQVMQKDAGWAGADWARYTSSAGKPLAIPVADIHVTPRGTGLSPDFAVCMLPRQTGN